VTWHPLANHEQITSSDGADPVALREIELRIEKGTTP
jgi:hypothetical protein